MKEFDFITVHDRDTNNLVILNIKYIYRITVEEEETVILFNYDNDMCSLEIKETPDKILNKLKEKGYNNFIKLHDIKNYPEILNMNYIAVISKDDDKISCKFCDHYYTTDVEVIEKLEKIQEMIKNLSSKNLS